uniref:Uncharacterized protein n=1 Tax=Plectus sambesii TaxID=2011161 RepID=A0A914XF81_9BILA
MGLLVASFVLLLTIQSLHLCSAEDSASINRLGEALDGRFGDLTAKTTNGQFGPWSAFTACSRSCGGGTKKRTRICLHGKTCRGPTHEQQTCNAHLCGSAALGGSTILRGNSRWNEWADWTACTKTCGGGEQTRFRY